MSIRWVVLTFSLAALAISIGTAVAEAQCVQVIKKPARPLVHKPVAVAADDSEPGLTTISFGGYPAGTAITTQYQSQGIDFSGANPYIIANNDSEYVGPALVGNPPCHGTVTGKFVDPLTLAASAVDQVSIELAGFNSVGTTKVSWFSQSGVLLSSQTNAELGVETFSYQSSNPRIGSWTVQSIAEDLNGWGVVSVTYDTPTNLFLVDPYLVNGASSGTIPVASVVSSTNDYGNVQALGLAADGASAMIAVVPMATATAVTLQITGGAKLAPYDPTFLQKGPVATATSLSIPVSSLYHAPTGGYYALALVESSGSEILSGLQLDINLTALSSTLAKASVPIVPTPVIFVHGLWGDDTSLSYVLQTGLQSTAPWNSWANVILDPICYSKNIAFNASSDPVPNNNDPCEYTSERQMVDEFNYIRAYMDVNHVAGGARADIVAHSMGGLVARSFSGTSNYKGLRDRGLGLFRMVVTIDTPETGSSLATYLVNNSARAYNLSTSTAASLAWHIKCGNADSLAVCLNKLGDPISGPGQPLQSGAVYSLEPGGSAIASAPSPQIPNVQWRAVNAIWPDTASPKSLLRGVLGELLAATYASNATVPTLTSILGTPANDVIVTQVSQTAGASSSQIANATILAHTGLPYAQYFSGLTALAGYTNYSVLQSYLVNDFVSCWLKSGGSSTCSSMGGADEPAPRSETEEFQESLSKPNFAADERIAAVAPAHKIQLATPIEIPVRVLAPGMEHIVLSQSNAHGEIPFGGGDAKILRQEEDRQIIEFTPMRLGQIELEFMVRFADGGVSIQRLQLEVESPATKPSHFQADKHSLRVLIEGSKDLDHAILEPSAKYVNLPNAIPLDFRFVEYSLVSSEDEPVIELKDGQIRALRTGEAIVEAHYGGVVDRLRVLVKSDDWK